MRFATHPTTKTAAVRWALCALLLAAWGVALASAGRVFGPGSLYVQPFNSDSALPVLMANDPVIDAFRTYVYGQDQIARGPTSWRSSRAARRAGSGRPRASTVCKSAGSCWACWRSLGSAAPSRSCPARSSRQRSACTRPSAITCSCSTSVTRGRSRRSSSAGSACAVFAKGSWGRAGGGGGAVWHWRLLAFWFSLLAVWMSPLSAPMLAAFLALEIVRARLLAGPESPRTRLLARALAALSPLAAAVAAEQLLKWNYHRHALKHYGTDFRTPTVLDWGHLRENLSAQLDQLVRAPWSWLTLAGVGAGALAACCLVWCAARRSRAPLPAVCAAGARLDAAVLLAGCSAAALINFAAAVLFEWIRLNRYGGRYLALTHLFGALAGLLAVFLGVSLSRQLYAARRWGFPLLSAAAASAVLILFPPARENPGYRELKETAAELARRAPGGVVTGGYWDTYLFAALAPEARLVAVPADDQLMRTPWTPRLLARSPRVIVVHHPFAHAGEVESPAPYETFGDGQNPPPFITQRGLTLRLAAPRWLERGGYVFSLYANENAAR